MLGTVFLLMLAIKSVVCILQPCEICESVTLLPYGISEGDFQTPTADDGFIQKEVIPSFKFYGKSYNKIFINNDGLISFNTKLTIYDVQATFPIAQLKTLSCVFCADIDIRNGGSVWYNIRTDSTTRATLASELTIYEQFPPTFKPSWVFVGTWENVKSWANDSTEGNGNTFQVILATDGDISVIMYLYKKINWIYDSLNVYPEEPIFIRAKAGFNAGDGTEFFQHTDSNTEQMLNINLDSNINLPGQFIYRVDTSIVDVTLPETTTVATKITTDNPTTIPPSQVNTVITKILMSPTSSSITSTSSESSTSSPSSSSPASSPESSGASSQSSLPPYSTESELSTSYQSPSISSVSPDLVVTSLPSSDNNTEAVPTTESSNFEDTTKLLTIHYALIGIAAGILIILPIIVIYSYYKCKKKTRTEHNQIASNGAVKATTLQIPRPKVSLASNKVHSV